jgi:carbamate kinase
MLVVAALGGNALLRRNEPLEAEIQRRNIFDAVVKAIAPLARKHGLVITHGNGPQIGLLALQAAAYKAVAPYPLDVLGAESEAMVGYLIEQALANELPGQDIATLLTQVEVDPGDPAFARPTKPIGPVFDASEVERLAAHTGWTFMPDGGGFRRSVPSPEPLRICEIGVIKLLVKSGVIVICAGGGGIPVADSGGAVHGVDAVIDKDLSATLLAEEVGADALLLLTDVPGIWSHWPPAAGHAIDRIKPRELRDLNLAAGTMGPKAEAACRFVERTGRFAAIGALDQAEAILDGNAGTIVCN